MKPYILTLLSTLFLLFSCSKSDNSDTIPKDTSEYLTFNITSDSLDNERITIANGDTRTSVYFQTNTEVSIGINQIDNGKSIFFMNIEATKEGTYSFDDQTVLFVNIEGYKGKPALWSKTGQITITHFPAWSWSADYITGTFTGEFKLLLDEQTKFTITNGSFRIKRKY